MNTPDPLALSPADAAAYVGLSRRTVSRLIEDGTVIARRHGRRTMIDGASLRAWYAAQPIVTDHEPLFPK
jgi:excisionase family DNA binding protein